eukprot:8974761-Lingulodinium_polyedra.AAC.1
MIFLSSCQPGKFRKLRHQLHFKYYPSLWFKADCKVPLIPGTMKDFGHYLECRCGKRRVKPWHLSDKMMPYCPRGQSCRA